MISIEDLLESNTPRLFWTPDRTWTNECFRANVGDVPSELSEALRRCAAAPESEGSDHSLPGYVGHFVRFGGEKPGILATFNSQPASLTSALPTALDALHALSEGVGEPEAYVRIVFNAGAGLFTACWLLSEGASGTLVPVHLAGRDAVTPMRRFRPHHFWKLHERRTGAVLTGESGRRALALPLNPQGHHRFIGLLELREGPLDDTEWAFVKAIAARGLRVPESRRGGWAPASTSVRVSAVPDDPRIVYLGPPSPVAERLAGVLSTHGWTLECMRYLPDLLRLGKEARRPSLLVLGQPSSWICGVTLHSIRSIGTLRNVPLLTVLDKIGEEVRRGSDATLATDAEDVEILRAVKSLLALGKRRRREELADSLDAFERSVRDLQDYRNGAQLAARWIGEHLAKWVYVEVSDGDRSSIVVQPDVGPRLSRTPATFLDGFTTIQGTLGRDFIGRISADSSFGESIHAMHPTAGASLLLGFDGKILGGIVCLALGNHWDAPEAEALVRCAEIVSRKMA